MVPFGLCRVGEGAKSEWLVPFLFPSGFAFRALWGLGGLGGGGGGGRGYLGHRVLTFVRVLRSEMVL